MMNDRKRKRFRFLHKDEEDKAIVQLKDKISRKSFDIIYMKEEREKFWENGWIK